MDDDDSKFYLHVALALSGCQLVEQQLKLYIAEALELVAKRLDGQLPFSMQGSNYDDASLERLINTFKMLSNEPQLLADLNKFKDERNFLSHRAITSCLDPEGNRQLDISDELEPRLQNIRREADRLYWEINEAANKFRGHLYFDPIPEET
jgi:hypothetical protein